MFTNVINAKHNLYKFKENEMANITLNPAMVYLYFRKPQKYITERKSDSILNDILECVIAAAEFEIDDYELLYHNLRTKYLCHCDTEWHYRIAIENNNNTAWKSIEKFLDRKPYIINGKRCYAEFKFQLAHNEYYHCTGWNEQGNIKFVVYHEPNRKGIRKLLNFTREQFNEYFKNKKII